MSASRLILIGSVLLLGLANPAAFAVGKPRSISTSRQFLVYGSDVALRGAMCDLAERTKSDLLRLLDLRDSWKTPLIINLDHPQANLPDAPAAGLAVSQLGYGLKLQLNLLLTKDVGSRAVQEELLRAILLEIMYRERANIAAGTPYVTPPDWLVAGVLGLTPGRAADGDAQLLQTIVASKKITPLEEIIRQRRVQLDASSGKFFDACSRALVQQLLDAPGGRGKLAQFILDLPAAPNDAMADLPAHFPDTIGRSPEKWWALSVARLSAADRYQVLSAAETAAQLARVLHLSIPGRDGTVREYSLGEYEKYRRLPAHKGVLRQLSQQLLLLSGRAHPFYRAVVQEEYELAELLVRGKTRRISERLARVTTYQAVIQRQASEIDDYLNWFEATQAKTMSGTFTQMLETARMAEGTQPRRRDPISVYLDSIEMEME